MDRASEDEVTCLLRAWRGGDEQALEQLMPLIYAKLRGLAARYLRSEQAGHTLQPTALVHEAYLRLAKSEEQTYADRVHFYSIAARVMRYILLDWAKARHRDKRGGRAVQQTLEEHMAISSADPDTLLEINRLIERMEGFDARKVKVVEMIFFGGMTYDEVAEVLGVSAVTVHRELKMAKAWMYTELTRTGTQPTL